MSKRCGGPEAAALGGFAAVDLSEVDLSEVALVEEDSPLPAPAPSGLAAAGLRAAAPGSVFASADPVPIAHSIRQQRAMRHARASPNRERDSMSDRRSSRRACDVARSLSSQE